MKKAVGRLSGVVLAAALLVACASTPQGSPGDSGRTGMNRVSPVRAAEINTQLGVGYFQRGEMELAVQKLERAVELDSAHVPAIVTLALVEERLGRISRARDHYQRAARLAPEDGATLNTYATFLCRQGDFEQAETFFQRALDDPFYRAKEVILTNAGACALSDGRLEEAERYLRQAIDRNAEFDDALYHLARLFLQRDDAFRARAFLQRHESVGSVGPDVLALGYRIEQRLGNPREAARYLERLEERFPESAEAKELRQTTSQND
jgi:type IV pilus assembly protein PilF